jgi:hypothetical protein
MNFDRSPSAGPRDFASALRADAIPSAPPPDAMAEVERAAGRYEELRADRRQLHFEVSGRRVRVEVQDLDGTVLKRIPSISALDIAAGGPI